MPNQFRKLNPDERELAARLSPEPMTRRSLIRRHPTQTTRPIPDDTRHHRLVKAEIAAKTDSKYGVMLSRGARWPEYQNSEYGRRLREREFTMICEVRARLEAFWRTVTDQVIGHFKPLGRNVIRFPKNGPIKG